MTKPSALVLSLLAVFSANTDAGGPMSFKPLVASAYGRENDADIFMAPWLIPHGYTQTIVSDENDLNLYVGHDWNDMLTTNETGEHAGRYLYRTHEVRGANATRIDGDSSGAV